MPVTSPPMGSNVPPTPESGSPLSDPRALEEYFRAHFSELATEAKAQLDDAASSAPRVVEGAFRHAWEEREHFQTPQQLDAFLHDEVKHGAAREKSRRASLHRHDPHAAAAHVAHATATADVEQSWTHLARSLHLTPEANTAAVEEVAAHLRHDAAGHVADMAKKRSWKLPITIGVVAAILVAGGIWYVDRLGDEGAITGALASPDARTHVAATAQLAIVTLDDGTRVELTPESKLIVPKQFGDIMRAVKLDGEATFTVPRGHKTPFEVRAGNNTKAVVTGTVLTVRSFSSESTVVIYLKEGSANVSLVGSRDSARVVGAGHALLVTKAGVMREPTGPELEEATSWNEHTLTIANRQLRDALPQLRRWYGIDIKVTDLPLLDRPVTIQAALDSPNEAIGAVEQSANVKFGWEDKTMVFRDGKTAKSK
jgi:ferric-dicitrate binding protein FerR (iron transport regulator)